MLVVPMFISAQFHANKSHKFLKIFSVQSFKYKTGYKIPLLSLWTAVPAVNKGTTNVREKKKAQN